MQLLAEKQPQATYFLLLFRLAHFNTTVSDPSSSHQGRSRHGRFDMLEIKSALLVSFESNIQYHYFHNTSEIFIVCNYFYSTSGISVGRMSIMFPKSRHTCAGGLHVCTQLTMYVHVSAFQGLCTGF